MDIEEESQESPKVAWGSFDRDPNLIAVERMNRSPCCRQNNSPDNFRSCCSRKDRMDMPNKADNCLDAEGQAGVADRHHSWELWVSQTPFRVDGNFARILSNGNHW